MLAALQSLYRHSTVRNNILGRTSAPRYFETDLEQGCPSSPALFGLLADGLHRYVSASCPWVGVDLDLGHKVGNRMDWIRV